MQLPYYASEARLLSSGTRQVERDRSGRYIADFPDAHGACV